MDLETHILQAIQGRPTTSRATTISDLSRLFGASPFVVLAAARHLVDEGRALPAMVDVRGVPTLRGLFPVPAAPPA